MKLSELIKGNFSSALVVDLASMLTHGCRKSTRREMLTILSNNLFSITEKHLAYFYVTSTGKVYYIPKVEYKKNAEIKAIREAILKEFVDAE